MIQDSGCKNKSGGFVGIIILIILALVAAKYFFDFSIFNWAASPQGKEALAYLWKVLAWLKTEALALWAYIH
jgi:hypothetical protein